MGIILEWLGAVKWYEWLEFGLNALTFLITCISIYKAIKNKKWEELKALLREEIIPLMEQAEKAFDNGDEREEWVIKKLNDKLHIDLFKYKKVLTLIKNIIAEICATTQIQVNNIRIVQSKTTGGTNNDTKVY